MASKCPECASNVLDIQISTGECICRDCGLVIDDSQIDYGHYREGTSQVSPETQEGRIVKANWLYSSKEKNINRAKIKLNLLAGKLALPNCIEDQILSLYSRAVEKDLCVGRDNESILSACIYLVCLQNNIPKTALEITEFSQVDYYSVLKYAMLLKSRFGLKINDYDLADMLPRFISNLKLSNECLNKSMEIVFKIKGSKLYNGKNPKSILAASIYAAAKICKEKLSQRQVSNELGVMEVTIRKKYQDLTTVIK